MRKGQPGGWRLLRKVLLLFEILATVALFAAGLFFFHLRQTLAAELQWAQQMQAVLAADSPVQVAVQPAGGAQSLYGAAALQPASDLPRLRIPAVDFSYPVAVQALDSGSSPSQVLLMPLLPYGKEACALARLGPGDWLYLDAHQGAAAFQIVATGQGGAAPVRGAPGLLTVAYPCLPARDPLLIMAKRADPSLP